MQTQEVEVHHPLFARFYASMSPKAEKRGQAERRRKLLLGLEGRVIEVGAGNGLNFAHYPTEVSDLVAIEPEPYLRERATEAAEAASVPVQVVPALAEELPADDGSFDAGIASLLLCSVADPDRALSELFRVIKPGGELRFYEHVVSDRPSLARFERVATRAVWRRMSGGCHLDRDTTAAIERAGFEIDRCERFPFTPFPFPPRISHVLGAARRDGNDHA